MKPLIRAETDTRDAFQQEQQQQHPDPKKKKTKRMQKVIGLVSLDKVSRLNRNAGRVCVGVSVCRCVRAVICVPDDKPRRNGNTDYNSQQSTIMISIIIRYKTLIMGSMLRLMADVLSLPSRERQGSKWQRRIHQRVTRNAKSSVFDLNYYYYCCDCDWGFSFAPCFMPAEFL